MTCIFDTHPGRYVFFNLPLHVVVQFFVEFPLDFPASEKRPKPKTKYAGQTHPNSPRSDCSNNERNGGRQPLPLRGFVIKNLSPGFGRRVVFGPPIVLANSPF